MTLLNKVTINTIHFSVHPASTWSKHKRYRNINFIYCTKQFDWIYVLLLTGIKVICNVHIQLKNVKGGFITCAILVLITEKLFSNVASLFKPRSGRPTFEVESMEVENAPLCASKWMTGG